MSIFTSWFNTRPAPEYLEDFPYGTMEALIASDTEDLLCHDVEGAEEVYFHGAGDIIGLGLPNTPWGAESFAKLIVTSYFAQTPEATAIYSDMLARYRGGEWPVVVMWPFMKEHVRASDGKVVNIRSTERVRFKAGTPRSLTKAIYDRGQMVPKAAISPHVVVEGFAVDDDILSAAKKI